MVIPHKCQIHNLNTMSEGNVKIESLPIRKRFRLVLRRHLDPRMKRKIKTFVNLMAGRGNNSSSLGITYPQTSLKAGDLVRIRPREEIEATLDHWGALKGCAFMSVMIPYCGTIQRVLKPVKRFVDERDYQVKKSNHIYILEGLLCEGTPFYGSCDRSCFFFWRVEWLEKIEESDEHQLPSE